MVPEAQAIRLHVAGPPGAPAVLLLHGIPGSAAAWKPVVARLESHCQVFYPDLLGFGGSSRPREIDSLWADRQAESLHHLLRQLGIHRLVLVGHDFGGPVAAHLLRLAPERVVGLMLAATNLFADTPIPPPLAAIKLPLLGRLWERAVFSPISLRAMLRLGVGEHAPHLDPAHYIGDAQQAHAIRTIFAAALRELRRRYAPVEAATAGLDLPACVLWGDRDPFFPVAQGERTARHLGNAEFVVLPGAGHFLPEERPAEMASAIWEMVRRSAAFDTGRLRVSAF